MAVRAVAVVHQRGNHSIWLMPTARVVSGCTDTGVSAPYGINSGPDGCPGTTVTDSTPLAGNIPHKNTRIAGRSETIIISEAQAS